MQKKVGVENYEKDYRKRYGITQSKTDAYLLEKLQLCLS